MSEEFYLNFLSPTLARRLEGRNRSVASHALRNIWHFIYDDNPRLLDLFPSDGKELLDPFLDYLLEMNEQVDWKVYFRLFSFVQMNFPSKQLSPELSFDLIKSSLLSWAKLDCSNKVGVVIYFRQIPDKIYVIFKEKDLKSSMSLKVYHCPQSIRPDEDFAYYELTDFEMPKSIQWNYIYE